jgi:hypothetical protein
MDFLKFSDMAISMLIRIICITVMLFSLALSAAGYNLFPPADYIHAKLKQNDIVFLGTTHKKQLGTDEICF